MGDQEWRSEWHRGHGTRSFCQWGPLSESPPQNNDCPSCHGSPTLKGVCRSLCVELSDSAFYPRPETGEFDPPVLEGSELSGRDPPATPLLVSPFSAGCRWQPPFSGYTHHFHFLTSIFFNLYNRFSSTSFRQLSWVGVVIVEALPTMIKKTAAYFFFFCQDTVSFLFCTCLAVNKTNLQSHKL